MGTAIGMYMISMATMLAWNLDTLDPTTGVGGIALLHLAGMCIGLSVWWQPSPSRQEICPSQEKALPTDTSYPQPLLSEAA